MNALPSRRSRRIAAPVLATLALALSVAPPGARAQVPRPAPPPAAPAKAQTLPVLAIAGAIIHTGTGEVIDKGVIVIEGGKIREVGKGITPPAGAQVIDANGSVITPGLTDALTSIGLVEVSLEPSARDNAQAGKDLIRAGFRAADGYNPVSSVIFVTRAEGVTSAGVIPSGGMISGQSAWADLDGASAQDAIAKAPLALHVHLDEGCEGGGACHATALLKVREAFDDARTFARTRAAWERNQSRPFAPSRLDLEALSGALDGKLPVVFHVNRATDILAALSLARELNLKPIIAGGAEAWREAKALAAQKVPVIVFPLASDPDSFDSLGAREDNAAILHAAGVKVVISTGDTHNARKLRQVAGNAVRAGLPHAAAITALTAAPAQAFGLDDRYGTLAKGKTANLVVWSADPLEIGTQVQHVFIRGRKVSLENRQTALFAKYRNLPPAGTPPAR